MSDQELDSRQFESLITKLERVMMPMKEGLMNDGLNVEFYSHRHAATVHSMGLSASVENGTILLAVNIFCSSGRTEIGANIQSDFQLWPDKGSPAFFKPYSKSAFCELSRSLAALFEKFSSVVRYQGQATKGKDSSPSAKLRRPGE